MIKMISIILGGGAGTRLYPLTADRSKPAVPIGGKYRLIDIPISNCLNSGVRRMFVLTQYNSASLNAHIANTYQFDAFSSGFVNVLAAEQTPSSSDWYQGTADAVRQSMHHVDTHDYDYVLILSGDQLYQMDFEDLVKYHIEKNADVTLATIPVVARDASAFGIMKVNADGGIDSFIEKPAQKLLKDWKSEVPDSYARQDKHYLASMGIYVFSKAALKKLFREHPDDTDFGKQFIPTAITSDQYKVVSYSFDQYWSDIGTVRSFYEENIALTDAIPKFNLFDNKKVIYTRGRMLAPSKFFGTRLFRSVISEGCIIHAEKIERSLVGIRSRIGKHSVVTSCIVMGNDHFQTMDQLKADQDSGAVPMGVGEYCVLDKAILDKDCRIGDHVIIRGGDHLEDIDTDTYCVRDGIVVVRKGATIPSGTKIGVDEKANA